MSPLKIIYHFISSVTVSSSNRHPVSAGCLLSKISSWKSWHWKMGQIRYP